MTKTKQRQRKKKRVKHAVGGARHREPGLSPLPARPAVDEQAQTDLLHVVDAFAPLRAGLARLGRDRGYWAGMPMPLDDLRLIIEPQFPNAQALMSIFDQQPSGDCDNSAADRIINRFWSWRWRCEIVIWERHGKREWGKRPRANHIDEQLSTLDASVAWGIEQEARAIQTLAKLLSHHAFKKYLLTGMFLEQSKRSHVIYLFRRLRPTVAISLRNGRSKVLCALCLHPIAYYENSWAGAMCPTDDVIGHLMLMRGDEAMFWRRANQHPAYRPEAGL